MCAYESLLKPQMKFWDNSNFTKARLVVISKAIRKTFNSVQVVQQVGKSLHQITDDIGRWRKILEKPYQEWTLGQHH